MIKNPKQLTVRVERAIRMGGEEVPAGTVLTLDYPFAAELLHAQKVSRITEQPAPVAEPQPAPKAGKTKSEKPLTAAKGE